jgi:hypothetical protein
MVINTTGKVGIGLTNPLEKLHVNGDMITSSVSGNIYYDGAFKYAGTGYGQRVTLNSTDGRIYLATTPTSGTLGGAATLNNRMIIEPTGNIGVGVAPIRRLHVSQPGTMGPFCVDAEASSGFIDTVILARTNMTANLTTFSHILCQHSGTVTNFAVRGDGNVYNTNNVYAALSDSNMKENIQDARGYLDDLMRLRVARFSFKSENSPTPTQLGLIAQEVQEVFPTLVEMNSNTSNLTLKYSVINTMSLKAIQELNLKYIAAQSNIVSLENHIEALTSSNIQLHNEIAAIKQHLGI